MDLSTTYLGFSLPHPFLPGASPLVDDLDMVRRLEDAGAAAIVMHSLFEEQITREQLYTHGRLLATEESHAEAHSYLPEPPDFALGPDEYLEQIRKIKAAVSIPVIASLNGTTDGGWLTYARLMEQAGADALELNVYALATDFDESSELLEKQVLHMLWSMKSAVHLPVAVKLSPFYTALAHFARRLDDLGADGLVLFNRFYQPDFDLETLEVTPALRLSDSSELLLRLRWLAILSGRVKSSLAVTGGVHTAEDAIKAVMAGAHVVQLVSALLKHGPERLRTMRQEVAL
jgi:dihydroorotate dehydrogenase (fumarate)